ncbi:MAG: thioredoxin-like domain-containing protein [Saprospiraceae bacterium]|nr:thioredoxin-like domain-containing protein [Saprospiraceae bacterium]
MVGQVDSAIARTVRIEFKRNHFLLEDGSFETALDANNTFSFRVKLAESRAVYFTHRNETVRLFLAPGDTLKMHFKSRHLLETMVYDGSAALSNDYLLKAELQLSEAKNNERAQYSVKTAIAIDHQAFIDSIFNEKKRFYDTYPISSKIDFSNDFLDFILNDNNYWRAYYLMEYVREHGLTNPKPERQVDDNYFAFLYETDNAYYKALSSQNYVQYLELYLGYLREKSGRGKQTDGDTLEIHSRTVQKVRSNGKDIRVLEEPYLKNDIVSWLSRNEEAEYQNLSTSEKFKYILSDTTIEDIFLRVKTPEGRYGWVPQSMVNLYDRTKYDTIHRRRFCYQPEKEFCGFEDDLTGKVLYFTMTKDILMGFMYDSEPAMKARMDAFIARNTSYEEYNTTLKSAFQRTLLERSRGQKNRVFIPASCEIERYDRDRDYYYATLRELPLANRVIFNDNSASLALVNRANAERLRLASENRAKAEQEAKQRIAEENRLIAERDAATKLADETRLKAERDAATKLADEAKRLKQEQEAAAKLAEDNRLWEEQQLKSRVAEENRIKIEKEAADKLAEETRIKSERDAAAQVAEANRIKAVQETEKKAERDAAAVSSKVLVGGNTLDDTAAGEKKPLFEQNKIVNASGVKDPNEIVNDPGDKNPANPNEVVAANGTRMIKQTDGTWKIVAVSEQPQAQPETQSQALSEVLSNNNIAKSNDSKKYSYLTAKGVELDTTQEIITLEDRLEFDPTGQFVVFKGMVAGEDMPRFVLTDIKGQTVTQEEMKNKVIFIDFWASWCGPCVAQFSHTKTLMEKYKNDDVLFLYISIDADLESWKEYLKNNAMAGVHTNDRVILPLNFQVTGIPNSFIIAKNGKIAFNSRLKSKLNDDRVLQVLLNSK